MSNLIGKYDIGGVLDRFRAHYGEQCLKSDRFQGHLEDFMDPDDPDRKLMIMFRDELENGDRKRLESEAFNRELMDAMYEDQTIDGLSDIMGIDRDQMKKYFMTHKMMNFHRKTCEARPTKLRCWKTAATYRTCVAIRQWRKSWGYRWKRSVMFYRSVINHQD